MNIIFRIYFSTTTTIVNFIGKTRKQLDPQNTRYFYKKLLKKEPKAYRALCRMVLIDYICFPEYKLPFACQDMESEVLETREMLLKM